MMRDRWVGRLETVAEHDGSYKLLFSHPRMVRDFLTGFVRQPWVEEMDLSTLEKVSQSYIADGLPIVLYNGRKPWWAALEVSQLIAAVPGGLEAYRPRLQYLLVDEERVPEAQLELPRNVAAALFQLERSRAPEDLPAVVGALAEVLGAPDDASLRRALTTWLRRVLLPSRFPKVRLAEAAELTEVRSMLKETVREWTRQWELQGLEKGRLQGLEKGRLQGLEKGRRQGEAQVLLHLLESRFGVVNDATRARIATGDAEQLLTWARRVLSAESLEEIFSDE